MDSIMDIDITEKADVYQEGNFKVPKTFNEALLRQPESLEMIRRFKINDKYFKSD